MENKPKEPKPEDLKTKLRDGYEVLEETTKKVVLKLQDGTIRQDNK